ncbi:MAG: CHAD domain-containing protein [Pyrinomonadaceae bacterium]|nr:CHAD domain-containing protein [Pyrinomonadaceae bacterium]
MAKAKEIKGIECDGPVTEAMPLVLGPRLEEMCVLRKAALDFKDPEGVHDMRVASRRVRSALRDFAPHLRKTKISLSAKDLKEIADKLGVVRDLDVAIIALEKFQKKATPEISSGLQQIIDDKKAQLDPARKELVQVLNYQKISQLKRNFLRTVDEAIVPQIGTTSTASGATGQSRISYKAYARSTLQKLLKELEASSPSLYEPQKVKPLHEMRIAGKRLRYAMELFAACWGDRLEVFVRQVTQIQSSLGELHDCDLWIEHFGKRLSRFKKKANSERETSEDERDAMIWLLSHFSRLRTKHFRAALARWHEWEEKDFCNRLTGTLRT